MFPINQIQVDIHYTIGTCKSHKNDENNEITLRKIYCGWTGVIDLWSG